MILNALLKGGVLTMENMSKKFLFIKIEEMNVYSKYKNKYCQTNQEFFNIISTGVHYVVHKTNLILQSLVDLTFIAQSEMFMMNI